MFPFKWLANLNRTYRVPQWQKSEDTEKKLLGSSTYLASNRPYMASFSGLTAPTIIGTTFTGCLHYNHQTVTFNKKKQE